MKNIIKGITKKKYKKFSTKRQNFLKKLELLGQKSELETKTPSKVFNKPSKLIPNDKKRPENIEALFSEYLSEIPTSKMDAQELLMSPLLQSKKQKSTDFKKKILAENKKKISLLLEKKKKYSISLIDNSLVNMQWFLKNEKRKMEDHYKKEFYHNLSESEQDQFHDLLLTQSYHPEDLEHDTIAFLEYKGSKLGPRIEDDPLNFHRYWKSSMSDSRFYFLKKMEEFFGLNQKRVSNVELVNTHDLFLLDEWADEFNMYKTKELEEISEYYEGFRGKKIKPEKQNIIENERNLDFDIEHDPLVKLNCDLVNDDSLPDLPTAFKNDETDYQAYMTYWGVMKTILNLQKQEKNKIEIEKYIISETEKLVEKEKSEELLENDKLSKKPNLKNLQKNKYKGIPSIMPYYDLLPSFLRKNQAMKTLCVTLEKKTYKISLEEKQKIINNFAQYCLPLKKADQIYTQTLLLGQKKYFATREDEIHLYDQTDTDMSINSKKKILLDNMKKIDETHTPEVNLDIYHVEDKVDGNPIDFYDNEDGFWDEFLKEKKRKLDDYPIYDSPAFFK